MSPQNLKLILRSISLSVGVALWLGGTVAMAALPGTDDSSSEPVVVDTEPNTTQPSTTPTDTNGSSRPISESVSRFSCQLTNGQYTVMYHPESIPNQSFAWATPTGLGGGWTPEMRCNEISRRLEAYRPDGLLELRAAVENNYNTVCVTTQNIPACRIVLTVPPGQDPMLIRDRVFENLTIADSGQQTQAVNTFVGRGKQNTAIDQLFNLGRAVLGGRNNQQLASDSINLRPFLDRADGGSGTKLRGGVPTQTNRRLNPSKFR